MRRPFLRFLAMAAVVLAGGSLALSAQAATDPGTPDTLSVDSVVAYRNGIGIVPLYFSNDVEITAVEVTLRQSTSQIKVDSFSFDGGRLALEGASSGFQITANSTIISVYSLLGSTPVPPGHGLMGRLYYSYPQSVTLQTVTIDTVTYIFGSVQHSTSFRGPDATPEPYMPVFKKGHLTILDAPSTMDSIWLAEVEATPGLPVAVEIYSFNELNLAEMTVALDYGSGRLIFDSISYLGGRGATADSKTVQHSPSAHTIFADLVFSAAHPLTPGSGVLATLHFTVDAATPDTLISIDSTTVGVSSGTRCTLTSSDGGTSFIPIFSPGSVSVKISTGVEDVTQPNSLPTEFALSQNYPNPFNPTTAIEFSLPAAGHVTLEVFNILGREVRRIVDQNLPAGVHRVTFDGRSSSGNLLATGVYFYRLRTDRFVETKKMLLLK